MIFTTTFNLFANAFYNLINALPTLPNYPLEMMTILNQVLDIIFQFGELILFFLPPWWLLEILVTYSIILEGFVIAYYVLMWLLNKVPIINVK